jgi:transposase-like protein
MMRKKMKGIFTNIPKFCPNCGNENKDLKCDQYSQGDFYAGASFGCNNCKFTFQHIEESILIEKLNGLLDKYFKE